MAKSKKQGKDQKLSLVVPIDASGIDDREDAPELKAVLIAGKETIDRTPVELDSEGKAKVTFGLDEPTAARVLVGPAEASEEEFRGLHTASVNVPLRAWERGRELQLEPLVIAPFYWDWWRRWCRTFTIRGRLVCPDGSPVPGAVVCARDVDRFWWWCSEQQVGCATTDVNGAFEITFRWCCGFWPWYWWRNRNWRIDPSVVERLNAAIEPIPDIGPLPAPRPIPDTEVFDRLLAPDGVPTLPSAPIEDPVELDEIRDRLVSRLPDVPELRPLWPWRPWHPWWDCTPDINFRVTQDCGHGEVVVVDEPCADARPNIPTTLDVTLVATDEACCVHPRDPDCPEGDCLVLTQICKDLVSTVGGNIGAPPAPEGYRSPGAVATGGDRPYAGVVPIRGICADWIDYYEFEISTDGVTWNPLPPNTTGGFTRTYFDPAGPPYFIPVPFSFSTVDGRWVMESLGHWESVNGPRAWVGDTTRLMRWITASAASPTGPIAHFADDTYYLRLRAWQESGGSLADQGYPPLCGSQDENRVVVTLDNRMVGPGAGHPSTPGHQCGGVHLCTTEPDTDFVSIKIDGTAVTSCAIVDGSTGTLEIEFLAHDPDGHLGYYTLHAYWGENEVKNLLDPTEVPSGSLTRVSAAQVGPDYQAARAGLTPENSPAAVAPTWNGGTMKLTITNIREAFEDPCCYLLELWAYKRTIDSCDHDFTHRNRSTYTFTVT